MAALPISSPQTAPAPRTPQPGTAPRAGGAGAGGEDISLVNLAARQRMLSQRIVLQTVLAVQGQAGQAQAARKTLQLFESSQARLVQTPQHLEPATARAVQAVYQGPRGVGATIDAFARQARAALDAADQGSARAADALAPLVAATDGVLEALNAATTVFDQIQRQQSDAMMRELSGIVESIQTVAREAKVVSFNAQVMAARAAGHGREFAVVANVLSGITTEIDRLSLQAVSLAGRGRQAA
ncbi:type IV pili methyl-accepting chemotaxis transducer N-terminal domain-containing protein [Acidovorax sp. NCPPB 4044]|uniref:type IV pili methyl-accepting chemotaxis transducer N-terminal domain-containing protein n=1 Tax=Acidovorax sp. NCPPB 4044 TaxID=2940490 RepID=UPI0023039ADE|nr:type IV pili methyl-accepting chemotaxis transducer N-terminal domain-containing protein [Acidovorax sp. NCPPB 4044]MDA8521574.1 type IV pili methyl-accepting chemotaxis transducer N-terminal domain-containing protein [Acidovorax sp. NCPPB 4044]